MEGWYGAHTSENAWNCFWDVHSKKNWNKQMSRRSVKLLLCKLQTQYSAKGTISAPILWYFTHDYHNLCVFMFLVGNMIRWSCVHSVFWMQNMIPKNIMESKDGFPLLCQVHKIFWQFFMKISCGMTLLMTLWCFPIVFLIIFEFPNDSEKFCKLRSKLSLHPILSLILGRFSLVICTLVTSMNFKWN